MRQMTTALARTPRLRRAALSVVPDLKAASRIISDPVRPGRAGIGWISLAASMRGRTVTAR